MFAKLFVLVYEKKQIYQLFEIKSESLFGELILLYNQKEYIIEALLNDFHYG